jgi:hypothetical protein
MANPPLERGNNFKRDRYQQLMDLGFSKEWIEKVSLHHTALFENPRAKIEALRQRGFDNFNADNDQHREHDFGSFELEGEKLFWKIDYYDLAGEFGAEDPTDPKKTLRVLTVMLAEEY